MEIKIAVPAERIADLFTTAIESGDPVTTAARGGWCSGVYWHTKDSDPPRSGARDPWYALAATFEGRFQVEIIEVDDETTGHETVHRVTQNEVAMGLVAMAEKFPQQFCELIQNNIDATTADAFLQAVVFGEEKYA